VTWTLAYLKGVLEKNRHSEPKSELALSPNQTAFLRPPPLQAKPSARTVPLPPAQRQRAGTIFVGRQREIRCLIEDLVENRKQFVIVSGPTRQRQNQPDRALLRRPGHQYVVSRWRV